MQKTIRDLTPYDPGLTTEQLAQKIGKRIIKLSANESLWGPSPMVYDALQQSCPLLNYYPDGAAQELKNLLAAGWHLSEEHFCLGNGADELIFLLANTFLNPGDEVVIPVPTFSSYAAATQIVGAVARFIPQPALTFLLTEIVQAVHSKTKMVFLCNPNNPTGTYFTQEDLELFLDRISAQTLVILDEAYCQYASREDFPSAKGLIERYPNLLVLRTFSKVYGLASLRIGYAVAHPKLIKELEKVRQPYNINTIAQFAAAIAWQDKVYVHNVVQETVRERERVIAQLRGLGLTVLPSQANFLLAQHQKAGLIVELLQQEGILVRHTASFGLPDRFRITIGPAALMEEFLAVLKKIMLTIEP
jgi:histidinol-phosphate aminotransferase